MSRTKLLIEQFSLQPHVEGGYYARVYSSEMKLQGQERCCSGSIFFLLEKEDISHFHQIDCEENWYFHEGCGLKIHIIESDGTYHVEELGLKEGQRPMVCIKKGAIFAAENTDKEGYTFISCTTTPQFRFEGLRLIKETEMEGFDLPRYLFL